MNKIIECIPNISEGRDKAIVDSIVNCVRSCPGVTVLNHSSDADHNRSVITFLGEPEPIATAAIELAGKAICLIDMTKHSGEHPRIGAVDVMPFVPFAEASMEDCIEIAKIVGKTLFERFALPVYLYEYAASSPQRKNLAHVRHGEFEGLSEKMSKPEWIPDFGGIRPHPTAGACAIGARRPLVAFNINLNTADVNIASAIAKIIRESNGGFIGVKALGILLKNRGNAQVSINMTDCGRTPLYRVLETVRFEARRFGVMVTSTELIGLSPMRALIDSAAYYLSIENFDFEEQVLENHFANFKMFTISS